MKPNKGASLIKDHMVTRTERVTAQEPQRTMCTP